MKAILLWDARDGARPIRLTVDDAIASAAVRAGIATAADPAQAGALAAGDPVSPADPIEVVLQHGTAAQRTRRVFLPIAVALVAAGLGLAQVVSGALPAGGQASPALPAVSATVAEVYAPVLAVPSYAGPLYRLVRQGDSATMDVYPLATGKPDYAAIDAWIGTSDIADTAAPQIDIIYGQKGTGANLTQPTAANRPFLTSLNALNGIRTFSFASVISTVFSERFMLIPGSLSLSRQAFGYHGTYRNRNVSPSRDYEFVSFDDGASTIYHQLFARSSAGGRMALGPATFTGQTRYLPSRLQTIGFAGGADDSRIYLQGAKETIAARAAQTMAAGGRVGSLIGTSATDGAQIAFYEMASLVFFGSKPSDADMASMEAWSAAAFGVQPATAYSKRLLIRNSSLYENDARLLQTADFLMALPSEWEVFNRSQAGTNLTSFYANRAQDQLFMDATKTKNVLLTDAPSNDIGSNNAVTTDALALSEAQNLYNNTTLAYVAYWKALHPSCGIVVPTVIPRGSFIGAGFREQMRIYYNQLVREGAAANGYVLSDRCAHPIFFDGQYVNLNYYRPDRTHLETPGTAVLSSIDRAAALAA